jgi:arginine N-succinyltransferase
MLKKIGFEYKNQVDPFDGGPHLWANVEDILPVKKLGTFAYAGASDGRAAGESGLLCKAQQKTGEFRAVAAQASKKDGKLTLHGPHAAQAAATLGLAAGEQVVFMPYY